MRSQSKRYRRRKPPEDFYTPLDANSAFLYLECTMSGRPARPRARYFFYLGSALVLLSFILEFTASSESQSREIQVGPITGRALTGGLTTIDPSHYSVPTVLFVFSPTCKECELTLPSLKYILSTTRDRYQFYMAATNGTSRSIREYLERHEIDLPVILISHSEVRRLGIHRTPTTVVIRPKDAAIKAIWPGPLTHHRDEVASVLQVNLPANLYREGKCNYYKSNKNRTPRATAEYWHT